MSEPIAQAISVSTSNGNETKRTRPLRPELETLSVELSFSRVSHRGKTARPHVLFSPMHYEAGYAYPLIVWLHGPESDERQITRVMPTISMRNYVGVAPQGMAMDPTGIARGPKYDISELIEGLGHAPKPRYDWPQNIEAIEEAEHRVFECIDVARQRCNIAPDRIFLVGFGTGGTMALRLAMLYPDMFGGVVSLCGAFPEGHLPLRQWTAARGLPTLLTVGNTSETFSLAQAARMLTLYHTAGIPIDVREYPCGQELSSSMLEDLNRWLMERVCSTQR